MKEHFTFLEKLYLRAPIQALYPNTRISIQKEETIINMPVNENHLHAVKGMHGSVYFRLLDDAAFFAANSIETEYFVLTASFNVKLLKPVNTGILKCVGKVKNASTNKIFAYSELLNEDGDKIATGEGIFMRSKILLNTID